MRIAAALILTLASSVALADQPAGFTATDDLWQFGGRTSATQPQQQPYSGILGQSEGSDWRDSPAPDSSGWYVPEMDSDQSAAETSTCSPSYGATYGSILTSMEEEECGT